MVSMTEYNIAVELSTGLTNLPLLAVVPVAHVPLLDAFAIEGVRVGRVPHAVL